MVLRLPCQRESHAREEDDDLTDFVACYNPQNRHERKETWDADEDPDGHWRKSSYDELIIRDKISPDSSTSMA